MNVHVLSVEIRPHPLSMKWFWHAAIDEVHIIKRKLFAGN